MQLYYQIFLFSICSNFITAQIFKTGSPFATKGEPFTSYCHILGDVVPYRVEIKKAAEFYSRCTVDMQTCSKVQEYYGPRHSSYDCGCQLDNPMLVYMNTSRIRPEDEGSWICKPSYLYSTPSPQTPTPAFLPVYYGPENMSVKPFYLQFQTYTMSEGGTYNFFCNASCNPPCSINWFKNTTDDGLMISPTGNLTFIDVDKSLHETAYFCKAFNSALEKEEIIRTLPIQVIYGPTDIEFNVDDTISVIEGEDFLNVSCFADCFPPCHSQWIDNNAYNRYDYAYRDYFSYQSIAGTMNMYKVRRSKSYNFTCVVENPNTLQNSRKNFTLVVQYRPEITYLSASSSETSEGSEVVIDCNVDSVPEANISWYRTKMNNAVISTDKSLVIPETTCSDSDTYTCFADNGIGSPISRSISIMIKCTPKIDSENSGNIAPEIPVMADNGGTVVLPIHVIAYPTPSFSWYRFFPSGNEVRVTDFRMKQVDTDSSSTLTIENMHDVDFGYYKVYVSNSEGVRSKMFVVVNSLTIANHNSTVDY